MALAAAIVRGLGPSSLDELVQRGVGDVGWRDDEGRTSVHIAAFVGDPEALGWLSRQKVCCYHSGSL
jgi:hypothetical protein